MSFSSQWIPGVGLALTLVVAACMVVLEAQSADYSNAAFVEVRDAQAQVVLRGQFTPAEEDDDDVERTATLTPTGVDTDATGEAEVEYDKATPTVQEVEFSIRNVQPGGTFTFVIDGQDVVTATADRRGRAEVELEVGSSATATR